MNRMTVAALLALALLIPLAESAQAQPGVILDPGVEQQDLYHELISPTVMEVAPDGRVIIGSREGQVTVWEQDGTVTRAAHIPVDAYDRQGGQFDESNCPRGDECPEGFNIAEGGIHGMLLAPDFTESGEIYIYYTRPDSLGDEIWPPKMPGARPHCEGESCPGSQANCPPTETCPADGNDEGVWRLSRFTLDLDTNQLDLTSELPLFENPAEWFYCCHYAGDLQWRNDGTLFLSTGDDSSSDHSDQYSPHDQRPDHTWNNSALSSGNPADRRGKMLRIDVAELEAAAVAGLAFREGRDDPRYDGVPGTREGIEPNPTEAFEPFAIDGAAVDPYVYAMGFRNPYRYAYSPETDHIYTGNVGPDARQPNPDRGPAAHDEVEVVPPGGGTNHGWPFCIGDNIAYTEYDFAEQESREPFGCEGMTPAAIFYTYYPYPVTNPFPQLGGGGNTAMGGVVYHRPDSGALRLPAGFDDQLLWMEYSRGQVWRTPLNADGALDTTPTSVRPLTGYYALSSPIDMTIGPDGAVYVIQAGGWNTTSGTLTRFACAGCTADAADYGSDVVPIDATADLVAASVDGGASSTLPTAATAGAIVLALIGLALRRRHAVA